MQRAVAQARVVVVVVFDGVVVVEVMLVGAFGDSRNAWRFPSALYPLAAMWPASLTAIALSSVHPYAGGRTVLRSTKVPPRMIQAPPKWPTTRSSLLTADGMH